ncbi:MAG: FAD-binding protein, partial [Microbacterium sp.]|nr:FAD-binding protein [Microbacterium sp.]
AEDRERFLAADATVLAAGGVGQVYRHTTNPPTATGDAVGLAWRAAAAGGVKRGGAGRNEARAAATRLEPCPNRKSPAFRRSAVR